MFILSVEVTDYCVTCFCQGPLWNLHNIFVVDLNLAMQYFLIFEFIGNFFIWRKSSIAFLFPISRLDHQNERNKKESKKRRSNWRLCYPLLVFFSFLVPQVLYDIVLLFISNGPTITEWTSPKEWHKYMESDHVCILSRCRIVMQQDNMSIASVGWFTFFI